MTKQAKGYRLTVKIDAKNLGELEVAMAHVSHEIGDDRTTVASCVSFADHRYSFNLSVSRIPQEELKLHPKRNLRIDRTIAVTCPFCFTKYGDVYYTEKQPTFAHHWKSIDEAPDTIGDNLFVTSCPECLQDFCHD